jgi:hypothetical protein
MVNDISPLVSTHWNNGSAICSLRAGSAKVITGATLWPSERQYDVRDCAKITPPNADQEALWERRLVSVEGVAGTNPEKILLITS